MMDSGPLSIAQSVLELHRDYVGLQVLGTPLSHPPKCLDHGCEPCQAPRPLTRFTPCCQMCHQLLALGKRPEDVKKAEKGWRDGSAVQSRWKDGSAVQSRSPLLRTQVPFPESTWQLTITVPEDLTPSSRYTAACICASKLPIQRR